MAGVNEMYDATMEQLSNEVISDTDSSHEEVDFDDIPTFLLSYVEASKSRAAIIENHILKEPDEFTASLHSEDAMNYPIEPQYYTMEVTEQVFCDKETEKLNASTDSCLLPTPTETEALLTHSNRGEDETHRISDISLEEKEEKRKSNEDMTEKLKTHSEYMKTEEQRRQTERDFQEELRIIMETEKLHQKELELMERRAQEKLEKEFLLQQEMISNLQRRVEEERRMKEEELKRIKDEEDKRKREEENMKIEAERKRMEEEARRKVEEEERRKIEMIKVQKEAERKREEEERRRMEREEMRRREEEERRKMRKDEVTMVTMEENEKKTEEVGKIKVEMEKEKRKNEEERKKIEEESKELDKKQKEKRESEGDMDMKKEEGCHKEDEKDRKKREKENIKTEREGKVTDEIHERMKQKELREKREEDKPDARKQMIRNHVYGHVMTEEKRENEPEERKTKESVDQKTEEEEVAGKRVKERIKVEVEQMVKRQEEENRKIDEELRLIKDGNQKKEGEGKTEENCRKLENMELRKDEEECKEPDVSDTTKQKEEKKEVEPDRTNMEATTNEEDAGRNKNEEQEEIKLNELSTNKMQEQTEHDGIFSANEKNNIGKNENLNPIIAEVQQEQQDLAKTSSQQDYDHPPARSSSVSEHIEKKRLSWMKDCVPHTKLSLLQSRRRREAQSRRGPRRRTAEAQRLPPLCLDSLLQSTGWKSLQEVTTVSLQDLSGCNLSTLAQCTQLQSLSLRRCGLKSLEGINQLSQLCYVDAQENDISFVDCENMTSLRVLQLSHNKLTSIHGLAGVENLNVLDLSHNFITRIAGLESARRLQRLLVNHNQLISTKGLRDVSTLLHLNCSHNHLASVEGLENSALLHTLDLRANSLTEPPALNNQVLLRELNLDDNSISSLQGLAACWLPLLQRLSVAQNRITQLHSLSETVSLESLDLGFNCLSEPQNVCESLRGCHFLREVCLVGNPLQQESSWRSSLQKAVPGLRAINDWPTDSPLSPPAVQEVSSSSGSFLVFCQAQLQQTAGLQQQHSRELSEASSSLDAVQTSCRHLSETLQLAAEQRFAHEIGDTTVVRHEIASKPTPEETLDMDSTTAVEHVECPDPEVPGTLSPNGDNIQHNCWTSEEKPAAESHHDTSDTAAADPRWPTISTVYSPGAEPSAMKRETEIAPASNHQDLDIQNTAAVVIQQLWRKYRQKCGNISSPSTAEKGGGRGGDGAQPKSGPSYINGSVVGQDYAATVIQALWRGFSLRRRLTSALAAVTRPDAGEDDTFEEVDVDEFVLDEAALEKQWTLQLCDDLPSRHLPVSEQPLSLKPLFQPFSEPPPSTERRSKQAWVADAQEHCDGHRSRSPASAASGLSERSEKILEEWGFAHSQTALQMLKRAQNMKSKKHQQKKLVPSFPVKTFYYQSNPEETWNTQTTQPQHNRKHRKAREAEKTERLQQERAQRWLHVQPLHSDAGSVSVHFLPEISSDVLNGGRVQLMADPGYTEHLHHASGLWAHSGLAARPRSENNRPGRNSVGRAKEASSPERVASASSKKERISFRDNPVQLSGGWGGGKKRDKVRK